MIADWKTRNYSELLCTGLIRRFRWSKACFFVSAIFDAGSIPMGPAR